MTIKATCCDCEWEAQGGFEAEMNEVAQSHEDYHDHRVRQEVA